MHGRIAKKLRRFFFNGANGTTTRASKVYYRVEHDSSIGAKSRGSFIVLDPNGPHYRYRIGKAVYRDATGRERRRMMLEADKIIRNRALTGAMPPSAEPGSMK